jgi:hypothetical protein
LSRGRLLLFRNLAKQINQSLIGFASLWCKAGDNITEVRTVERGVFVDFSGEEAFTKRAKWDEPDSQFLKCR